MLSNTLMIVDAPNIDMTLSNILNHKPRREERPDFEALLGWADAHAAHASCEATLFTNVSNPAPQPQLNWFHHLRDIGYGLFVKPRLPGSDVDDDMLKEIEKRHRMGDLDQLIVVSHDARNFLKPLEDLATDVDKPVAVTVVAFREFASSITASTVLDFRDLEDDTGGHVFAVPLPRMRINSLPAEGTWFGPNTARVRVDIDDVAA